jgi:hypothetical protein
LQKRFLNEIFGIRLRADDSPNRRVQQRPITFDQLAKGVPIAGENSFYRCFVSSNTFPLLSSFTLIVDDREGTITARM